MIIDRNKWKPRFTIYQAISWPCPSCNSVGMSIDKATLNSRESQSSKKARDHDEWEPTWINGVFSCFMKCGCGETIVVSGTYNTDVAPEGQGSWDVYEVYSPEYFSPSPNIFPIPVKTPKEVAEEIRKSFELSWLDCSASANRVRASVELLLNYCGVKRIVRKNGKQTRINLHDRIEDWKVNEPDLGSQLMSVKWLGNAGSHGTVTRDDIFDAFEILQNVITELFEHRENRKRAAQISRQIEGRKGPRLRRAR